MAEAYLAIPGDGLHLDQVIHSLEVSLGADGNLQADEGMYVLPRACPIQKVHAKAVKVARLDLNQCSSVEGALRCILCKGQS